MSCFSPSTFTETWICKISSIYRISLLNQSLKPDLLLKYLLQGHPLLPPLTSPHRLLPGTTEGIIKLQNYFKIYTVYICYRELVIFSLSNVITWTFTYHQIKSYGKLDMLLTSTDSERTQTDGEEVTFSPFKCWHCCYTLLNSCYTVIINHNSTLLTAVDYRGNLGFFQQDI